MSLVGPGGLSKLHGVVGERKVWHVRQRSWVVLCWAGRARGDWYRDRAYVMGREGLLSVEMTQEDHREGHQACWWHGGVRTERSFLETLPQCSAPGGVAAVPPACLPLRWVIRTGFGVFISLISLQRWASCPHFSVQGSKVWLRVFCSWPQEVRMQRRHEPWGTRPAASRGWTGPFTVCQLFGRSRR